MIRQEIIDAAGVYSKDLAGRNFLYVYGEEFFEVSFPADHFLHLTGVETMLSAKSFYKNAKKRTLGSKQFYFTKRHPYATAKKKLPQKTRARITFMLLPLTSEATIIEIRPSVLNTKDKACIISEFKIITTLKIIFNHCNTIHIKSQ